MNRKIVDCFVIGFGLYVGYNILNYAFYGAVLSKFDIILYGAYTSVTMVTSALSRIILRYYQQKTKKKLDAIIRPISSNINLTNEQKKERIELALKHEINKMAKSLGESK